MGDPDHDEDSTEQVYAHRGSGEHEHHIVGTPEGLTRLKELIEEAIRSGESTIYEDYIYWEGVVRVETPPPDEPEKTTWAYRFFCCGCIAAAGVLAFLLGLGGMKAWELIFR